MLNRIVGNYTYTNFNPVYNVPQQKSVDTKIISVAEQADSFERNTTESQVSQTKTAQQKTPLYYGFGSKLLLRSYLNTNVINKLADANPKVQEILDENGIKYEVHPENVSKIVNSHLTSTTTYALQIADEMGLNDVDKAVLEKAGYFHDFGKALIPDEILNKQGRLTDEEKEIMDLHSELGYELLSTTGLNKRVLNLIKDHHSAGEDDLLANILSVADIYSALREERCYKKALSAEQAIEILDQKAKNGEVSAEVVNALKSSVSAEMSMAA